MNLKPNNQSKIRLLVLATGVVGALLFLVHSKRKTVSNLEVVDLGMRLSKVLLPTTSVKQLSLELGMKLAQKKEFDAAKKVFEDLLATNPTDLSILNNLAYVAGEQGQLSKANEYLTTAIQISDKCSECFNNLGSVLFKQGKADEAKPMFLKAVALNGKYSDPKLNLAVLYEEQSDWVSALDWYRQAELDIADPEVKKWVTQRARWMSEIATPNSRQIANEK